MRDAPRLLAPLALFLFAAAAVPVDASGAGRLVVLNKSENMATILELPGGKVLATLPTGEGPHEVAISPDGRWAVIADYGALTPGRTLTVIDMRSLKVDRTLDLGTAIRPHGLAFEPDGKALWVTAETQQEVWRVSFPEGEILKKAKTGQRASHMVVHSADGMVYVANIADGSMTAVDAGSGEARSLPTGRGAEGIAVSADGKRVWVSNREVNTVSVIDAAKLEVIKTIECPDFPIRVYLTPDGKYALVTCARAGEVFVIDAASMEVRGKVKMELKAVDQGEGRLFGNKFVDSPVPIGLAVDADSRFAYVSNAGADKVAVVDLQSMQVVGALDCGREPDGIAWVAPAAE